MAGTSPHNFRIPDDVWDAASKRADTEHRTMSDVVVRLLRAYGEGADEITLAAPALGAEQAQPQRTSRKPSEPESASDIAAFFRNR